MSVQGIHGTTPTARISGSTGDAIAPGTAPARSRVEGTAEQTAAVSSEPVESKPPLRFPWLSRLSTQLAAASKTPTTFSAPVLGDNLDKRA